MLTVVGGVRAEADGEGSMHAAPVASYYFQKSAVICSGLRGATTEWVW